MKFVTWIIKLRWFKPHTNVSELKAFLGMLNYYHKSLNRLSTILEPFHKLLENDNHGGGAVLIMSCDASPVAAVLSH